MKWCTEAGSEKPLFCAQWFCVRGISSGGQRQAAAVAVMTLVDVASFWSRGRRIFRQLFLWVLATFLATFCLCPLLELCSPDSCQLYELSKYIHSWIKLVRVRALPSWLLIVREIASGSGQRWQNRGQGDGRLCLQSGGRWRHWKSTYSRIGMNTACDHDTAI